MSRFAAVPAEVLEDGALSSSAKLAYTCLCLHRGQDGRAWPSLSRLQRLSSLSRHTVIRALAELEVRGYIHRTRRTGAAGPRSTLYEIPALGSATGALPSATGALPSAAGALPSAAGALPSATGALPSATGALGVVPRVHWGSATGAPEQNQGTNKFEQTISPSDGSASVEDPSPTGSAEIPQHRPKDSSEGKTHGPLFEEVRGAWNLMAAENALPQVRSISDSRKRKLLARIKQDKRREDIAWWKKLFAVVAEDGFYCGRLTGRDGRSWTIDFDWLLASEGNLEKIVTRAEKRWLQAQKEESPGTCPFETIPDEEVPA